MNRREAIKGVAALAVAGPATVLAHRPSPLGPSPEFLAFKEALKADPDWAWSWHCNIACAAMDEGLSHVAANRAAARVMHSAFDLDTQAMAAKYGIPDAEKLPVEASAAVFAFAAWLTTREKAITVGAAHEASAVCELVTQFLAANDLPLPRPGWEAGLKHPS